MSSNIQGKHLHFDCVSGIAGDMCMGALIDAGVPAEVIVSAIAAMGLGDDRLRVESVIKSGIASTNVWVRCEEGQTASHGHSHDHHDHAHEHSHDHAHEHAHEHSHDHHDHAHEHSHDHEHTHDDSHEHSHDHAHEHSHDHDHTHHQYSEIRARIEASSLDRGVIDLSLQMFARVAEAEAKMHGMSLEHVAFHEVGAIDSIVDIVGCAAAIHWLAPCSVSSSAVAMGKGRIKCAHGVLPVPSPAAVEILRIAEAPISDGGVAIELCTPTGAAILATVVDQWGSMPEMIPLSIGYGAGDLGSARSAQRREGHVGHTDGAASPIAVVHR